jgi:LssY C-terminus
MKPTRAKSKLIDASGTSVICLLLGSCAFRATHDGDRTNVLSRLNHPLSLVGIGGETTESSQSKTINGVTVTARVLSDSEARDTYGANLAGKGLQAVWMRIENKTSTEQWMLAAHLDPDYFTADEAAYLFRHRWGGFLQQDLKQRFRDLTMRARLEPGSTHQGHVLLPRREGGRYVEITTNGSGQVRRFGFPLRSPDGHFDYERMNVAEIHKGVKPANLSWTQLRSRLEKLPAAVTDEDGTDMGDPVNLVIVGDAPLMLAALSECGWAFTHRIDGTTVRRMITAAVSGNPYLTAPVSSLYLFGRKHDVAFQRSRSNLSQRNHLRLWLAPFTVESRPIWIGQVSRDIGIKLTQKSPTLTTHVIDPMVDEARQFMLESLLLRFRISDFGFTRASDPVPRSQPRHNLTGDPYFTDGLRLVLVLSRDPVAPEKVRNLGWDRTKQGPVEFSQETPRP